MTETGLNGWERKIAGAFIDRYVTAAGQEGKDERNAIRLRSVSIFPGFDNANPDEKESYLEAAEALERKGLLSLNWEKRGEGERLKTLSCGDMGKLFEALSGKDPRAEAGKIRTILEHKILAPENLRREGTAPGMYPSAGRIDPLPFLRYLAERICSSETARGLDVRAVEDFICLLEFFSAPESNVNISTRALSVFLYRDSKRLENLLGIFGPLLSQAQRRGIAVPSLSFLERSFPDTMISGRIVFEYAGDDLSRFESMSPSANNSLCPESMNPPLSQKSLVNVSGLILGIPFSSAKKIRAVKTIVANDRPSVLTVENKETFYALGEAREGGDSPYDCFLYTGGYPNQAAAAMIRILAASGFCFYHAGDLDPDGILILQNIRDIAGRDIAPIGMDASVFDRYLFFARTLGGTMFRQLEKIREDTRAIPGLAGLIRRIEETGRGVEQEIIDYREF
jgi:hypothetical protein